MKDVVVTLPVGDDPPAARLLYGCDVREGLRALASRSVHCVATSPPYWGLRDYQVEPSEWDGWTGQLGLEPEPDLYVEHVVDVFREVRRVLRDDGTLWLNLGDSYNSGTSGGFAGSTLGGGLSNQQRSNRAGRKRVTDLKHKDLVGIPWRVALALQADGWWLRNDIIWHKANHLPSPVQDRFTCSYEHLFLLTKSPKYFFDLDAVRVPHTFGSYDAEGNFTPGQVWHEENAGTRKMDQTSGQLGTMAAPPRRVGRGLYNPLGKNPSDVWKLPTQPFPGAHFAVWPQSIPERCIKAGTSEHGCCAKCGTPWVKTEHGPPQVWEPTCPCGRRSELRRSVVLDPFSGSGTTGRVALRLGRDYVGIDRNEEYLPMAVARLRDDPPPEGPEAPPEGSVLDIFSSEDT